MPSRSRGTHRSEWTNRRSHFRGDAIPQKPFVEFHIVCAADHERHSLVNGVRLQIEDALLTRAGASTRLLDDEGQRRTLIQKTKLSVLVVRVCWIKVQAAF